jgi:hypothetical protein
MRLVTLVLALAAVSPALAQTAPDSAPAPVQTAPPAPPEPPAKTQDQIPSIGRENLALPPAPRGRYSFAPVDEGFLRFDHKSGEVALCKPQNGGWSCDAVPDSSAARQKEIDELRDQVATLQKEIASLRAPPPPPPHPVPPDTVPPSDKTGSITLKHDIARARGFIVDTWHRLVDMIDNLQKDMMRKGNDNGTSRT